MGKGGEILGHNLRELRAAGGLKQGEIANALGVPYPTYSSWERGRTEPNIDWLLRIARYYDVSVDRLLRVESRTLKVGSLCPLPQGVKFHPTKYPGGIFGLVYNLVFNRLFFFDIFEKRFHAELIDSWCVDRDRSSYIFYPYSDVSFHNGETLELHVNTVEVIELQRQFVAATREEVCGEIRARLSVEHNAG